MSIGVSPSGEFVIDAYQQDIADALDDDEIPDDD